MVMTEVDAHYSSISRQFFVSGASLGSRSSRKHEEGMLTRLPMDSGVGANV